MAPTFLGLKVPSNVVMVGSSQSGKTTLLRKLIVNYRQCFCPVPTKILYCYSESAPTDPAIDCQFDTYEGLPSLTYIRAYAPTGDTPCVIIFDDLIPEISANRNFAELFYRITHHRNICAIVVSQLLFDSGANILKKLTANAHYFVLFKSSRRNQIQTLATQIEPARREYFLECYKRAVDSKSFGYLVIDTYPFTSHLIAYRNALLNEPGVTEIYLPK